MPAAAGGRRGQDGFFSTFNFDFHTTTFNYEPNDNKHYEEFKQYRSPKGRQEHLWPFWPNRVRDGRDVQYHREDGEAFTGQKIGKGRNADNSPDGTYARADWSCAAPDRHHGDRLQP